MDLTRTIQRIAVLRLFTLGLVMLPFGLAAVLGNQVVVGIGCLAFFALVIATVIRELRRYALLSRSDAAEDSGASDLRRYVFVATAYGIGMLVVLALLVALLVVELGMPRPAAYIVIPVFVVTPILAAVTVYQWLLVLPLRRAMRMRIASSPTERAD